MKKTALLIMLASVVPALAADRTVVFKAPRYVSEAADSAPLPFVPDPIAAYVSSDGTGNVGTWNAAMGSGGVTALPFVPKTLVGIYYSTDGTGNVNTWVPCTSACFGAGSGAPATNPAGGANNYAPIANPSFTGSTTSPCVKDTGTALNVPCPFANTNATGPHWQSDNTATPASVIDSITGTAATGGLTKGIPANTSCVEIQSYNGTSGYSGVAYCQQGGSSNANVYISGVAALNTPSFTRTLSCSTACGATQFTAGAPYLANIGLIPTITSNTIAATLGYLYITATSGTISTMTAPANTSTSLGATVYILSTTSQTVTSGTGAGNFLTGFTMAANTLYTCAYFGNTQLWACK